VVDDEAFKPLNQLALMIVIVFALFIPFVMSKKPSLLSQAIRFFCWEECLYKGRCVKCASVKKASIKRYSWKVGEGYSDEEHDIVGSQFTEGENSAISIICISPN
jgi:hypothetical protein